jgi:hypothetical protein
MDSNETSSEKGFGELGIGSAENTEVKEEVEMVGEVKLSKSQQRKLARKEKIAEMKPIWRLV